MNIELHTWHPEDIASLVQCANNFNVWKTLRDSFPYPYTIKDAEKWVALNQNADPPLTNFSVRVDRQLAGAAGILLKTDIYRKNAEIGYWIAEPFWGKGIASEVIRQLTMYTFANFDIFRIYAEVFSNNSASMKALAKNGFRQESIHPKSIFKNDQFLDTHIWIKYRPEI